MSTLLPVAVYGLDVPPGDVLTPAVADFPAAFRVTMAAIDPSATVEQDNSSEGSTPQRATLKIIRAPMSEDDSELDSDDEDQLKALIDAANDDDDEDEDDEEDDAGPSDPSKSIKARKAKAVEELKKALEDEDDDVDMEDDLKKPNGVNGEASSKAKGKARATDEEDEDEDEDTLDMEEFVLCTLDPTRTYQQPLDLTVGEDERVFFKVSGTHTVYLTGNYVVPDERDSNPMLRGYGSDDEDEYDLSPDEDELEDEESDELDDLEDPRITELSTDEDDVPTKTPKKAEKQVSGPSKPQKGDTAKGKNKKREAEDDESEPSNLDDIMAKSLKPADNAPNGEPKLSKKQQKKLKNNAGRAVEAPSAESKKGGPSNDASASGGKADKRVQFAKNLETEAAGQGDKKSEQKTDKKEGKGGSLGIKTVQGVVIDDRKLGKGPAAKNGDRVSLRYIGKLQVGNRQFDANKSGPPFRFKLGAGEVIKGWDIGVRGMAAGGERRITIPPELGYGKKAIDKIPPNSTLVFEIKLLSIN